MINRPAILHVVISFSIGGLEKFVLDFIEITKDQYVHSVVCLENIGELALNNDNSNFFCLNIEEGLKFNAIFQICRLIKDNRIDILHTHNEKAQFYGSIAGFLSKIPVVHTKHGKNETNIKSRIRNNLISRFCSKIVAVSEDSAMQCIKEELINKCKVKTILNGINTDYFSPRKTSLAIKNLLDIKGENVVFGIVARLAVVKDHATLLLACQILKKLGNKFQLLVIGDGPLMSDLVSMVKSLELDSHVLFLGTRHDIQDILNILDIYVLSSISEGISLTLLEAMSCCLPVVATDVGGNPEVVIDGATGFIVPPKHPSLLAEKLLVLMKDSKLRKKMGNLGRERVVSHFSLSETANGYKKLYSEILNDK